jgi:predicted RNA-binding Zn-ribbon protein involved in translation (DUF1610 family)
MDNTTSSGPTVTCPQCGAPMVRESAESPEKVRDAHVHRGMNAHASSRFIDQMFQKTNELGPIFRCIACGYMMRVKGDAAQRAA